MIKLKKKMMKNEKRKQEWEKQIKIKKRRGKREDKREKTRK